MTFPVHRDGIRWIVTIPYQHRHLAKDAGFRWDPQNRYWWTSREDVARLLMDPAAAEAKRNEFARIGAERKALIEESRAASVDIELPAPHGLSYLPFQRAGIATALNRFGIDLAYLHCNNEVREKHDAKGSISENTESTCRVSGESGQRSGTGSARQGQNVTSIARPGSGLATEGVKFDAPSNARSGDSSASSGWTERTGGQHQGRKRSATHAVHQLPLVAPSASRMETGARHQDSWPRNGPQPAIQLQSGFRASDGQSGDRSGRPISQQHAAAVEGSEENSRFAGSWLEGNQSSAPLKGGVQTMSSAGVLFGDDMG